MKQDVEFAHMLNVVGTKYLSRLFVTSSTKQFHYTCLLRVVVATQKNQTRVAMDNWLLGYKQNAII
jgi:hypothetical protein